MPRPKKPRFVSGYPSLTAFVPEGVPVTGEVFLSIEELESVRLSDFEGRDQEAAANLMEVSRQTYGRILANARRVISEALVTGKALRVEGVTAGIGVLIHDVRQKEIIGGDHLTLADIGTALQFVIADQIALALHHCQTGATIDELEAAGLLDDQFYKRFRIAEMILSPPLALRVLDGKRSEFLGAVGDFGGLATLGACGMRHKIYC